jgi:hypothetical protein
MRVGTRVQVLFIAFAGCAAPAMAGGWNVPCGGLDKAPCAFNAAKLEGKQTSGLCATGQFFDLIQGGTCWSCPRPGSSCWS